MFQLYSLPVVSWRRGQDGLRSRHALSLDNRILLIAVLLCAVVVAALSPALLVAAAPTLAASEEIISVRHVGTPLDARAIVTSRLHLAAETEWEVDPEEGPLTLRVESGTLSVMLDGGSARIERAVNLFLRPEMGPLSPGNSAALRAGDQLVIVRGFHLMVENNADHPAVAIVTRLTTVNDD